MSKIADQTTVDTDASNPQLKLLREQWLSTNCLTILFHPQLRRIGERSFLTSLEQGQAAQLSRTEPVFSPVFPAPGHSDAPEGQALMLASLSRSPLELVPASDGGLRLVRGNYSKPVKVSGQELKAEAYISAAQIADGVVLELSSSVILVLHRYEMYRFLEEPSRVLAEEFGLVGNSTAMVKLHRGISSAAAFDKPVLLLGETGCGKELVAIAIHAMSARGKRPMVSVNMGGQSPDLARADFLGVEKGAFTGAVSRKKGYFRCAHQGTLFLDEIGETPAEIQALLLRVLETNRVQAMGSEQEEPVDVRIIAATDADLNMAMEDGSFRVPFYYRLAGFRIKLPPLRERRDDIGRLVVYFLKQELARLGMQPSEVDAVLDDAEQRWLSHAAMAPIALYRWPGNVRELRQVVGLLVAASRNGPGMELPEVPPFVTQDKNKDTEPAGEERGGAAASSSWLALRKIKLRRAKKLPLPHLDDAAIEAELRANGWEVAAAAVALDCSRQALYKRLNASSLLRSVNDISDEEIRAAYQACGGNIDRMCMHLKMSRSALIRQLKRMKLPV